MSRSWGQNYRVRVNRGDLGWRFIFIGPQHGICFVTLLSPKILRWLLDFCKTCASLVRPRPKRKWYEPFQCCFFKRLLNTKVKDLELRRNRNKRHHTTRPNATTGTALWLSPAMLLILKILYGVKTVACESDHRPSSRARNNKSPPYGLAGSSLTLLHVK
jgi:hypothetical protein